MPNRTRKNRAFQAGNECGFTLLEVLIAVMILGLCITAILQQFSVGLHAGNKTRQVVVAELHAREKLEEMKVENQLEETTASGSFDDGYEWHTEVIPFNYGDKEGEEDIYEQLKYETFMLRTTVLWHEGDRSRQVQLSTLRTVRKRKWK